MEMDRGQNVLVVQHSAAVVPSLVGEFLASRNIPHFIIKVWETTENLEAKGWKAVVVLGGPQGAYEDDIHPYLGKEKQFLRDCVSNNIPVLGICLGMQLLADAHGGKAYLGSQFEVGYQPITPTPEGLNDPVVKHLFRTRPDGTVENRPVLEHHGDTFYIPANAVLLAQSALYPQAIRIGSALGVQFHPEATLSDVHQWSQFCGARYASVGLTKEQVFEAITQHAEESRAVAEDLFSAWWGTVIGN
jgi:GMP synthase (glutamine-hydrolysing)